MNQVSQTHRERRGDISQLSFRHCVETKPTVIIISWNNTNNTQYADVPRKRGLLGRNTGDGTPYEFPLRPLEFQKTWPDEMPFVKDDFSRLDPFDDGGFYSIPRLVYHIDEPAVAALTQYYLATHL